MKLKITTDKTIIMEGIQSCTEISPWDNRQIDGKYTFEEEPKLKYFDIVINGNHKTLAVNGSVELIEIPVTENSVQTWDKKIEEKVK